VVAALESPYRERTSTDEPRSSARDAKQGHGDMAQTDGDLVRAFYAARAARWLALAAHA
jgi:hypothetical protein